CSAGATKLDMPPSPRSPRRPPRGARQPGRAPPAGASVRPLTARFFAASSAQLEESFSDLTDFLSPGLATPGAPGAPGTAAALWIVPLMPSLPATGLAGSSGFFAVSTLFGADII